MSQGRKPHITEPMGEAIISQIQAGITPKNVAHNHGVTISTLYNFLHRKGVSVLPHRRNRVKHTNAHVPVPSDNAVRRFAKKHGLFMNEAYARVIKAGIKALGENDGEEINGSGTNYPMRESIEQRASRLFSGTGVIERREDP